MDGEHPGCPKRCRQKGEIGKHTRRNRRGEQQSFTEVSENISVQFHLIFNCTMAGYHPHFINKKLRHKLIESPNVITESLSRDPNSCLPEFKVRGFFFPVFLTYII